jgi:hypothetical protein
VTAETRITEARETTDEEGRTEDHPPLSVMRTAGTGIPFLALRDQASVRLVSGETNISRDSRETTDEDTRLPRLRVAERVVRGRNATPFLARFQTVVAGAAVGETLMTKAIETTDDERG